MTAIKAYFLRLIFCGFLVSLSGTLLRGKKAGRVLALCGGCLLILTAVRPLLQVDLKKLPDLFNDLTAAQGQEAAQEKNRALLQSLVEQQTVAWLEEQAEELGISAVFAVKAREAEAWTFVPEEITISGTWSEAQRTVLTVRIERLLAVPAEKQRWREE